MIWFKISKSRFMNAWTFLASRKYSLFRKKVWYFFREYHSKFIFNFYNFFKLSKACRGLQNIDQTKALDHRSQNAIRVAHSVRNFMFFENKIQIEIIKVINSWKYIRKSIFSANRLRQYFRLSDRMPSFSNGSRDPSETGHQRM